jgi:hypothetical protein
MPLTFAYGRNTLPADAWTVTSTAGGNIPAGTYYLSLQGRNRIGYNLPIYTTITVPNNSNIVITINSSARVAGEDWHYYAIEASTTSDVTTYRQVAQIPGINPTDQSTLIALPITLTLSTLYLINVTTLPTTGLTHGTVIGYTPTNLIYSYDSYDSTTTVNNNTVLLGANNKRWKAQGNLSNYITATDGTLGCAQDLRSITDVSGIIVPRYNPSTSVSTLSTSVRYVLTPNITSTINKGTRIATTVRLSGLDKSSAFSNKLVFTPEGYVDLTTFELQTTLNDNTTPMSSVNTSIDYVYGKPYLILEDDLPITKGYQFKVQLKFSAVEYASLIPEGASISLNLDFTDSAGIYQELGNILGNIMFSDLGKGRVYPDAGLTVMVDGRTGLVKNYSFPPLSASTATGLLADTENQYVVINKNGNAYIAYPNIPTDSALRALVSTKSGRSNATPWSTNIAVTTAQGIEIVIPYPYLNDKGIIRADYPGIIAGSNKGVFNVPELVVYVRNMTTNVIKTFTFNVAIDISQTIQVLDWNSGTTVSSVTTQADSWYSLYTPLNPTSTTAITGGSNFTAANYQVSYCYQYNGNQVTKISHLSADLAAVTSSYIYELDASLADVFDRTRYLASPVASEVTLRTLTAANRTSYQQRYVISKNKEYRYDPGSTLVDDSENVIKPSDVDIAVAGRWVSSSSVMWFNGTTVPSNILGKIGDYYLLTTSSDLYQKTAANTWTVIVNIKGATGSTGLTGATGAPGSTWYNGNTVPSTSLGIVNDYYLHNITYNIYQKTDVTTWTILMNIKGATGAAGTVSSNTGLIITSGTTPSTTSTEIGLWNNAGILTIRDSNSGVDRVIVTLNRQNTFTRSQGSAISTLTDATTITVDGSLSNVFIVTLAGNRTLSNPTNLVAGFTYIFLIKQDATGSRTLTFGTNYKFGSDGTPTLSSSANAVDVLSAVALDTSNLLMLGIKRGY